MRDRATERPRCRSINRSAYDNRRRPSTGSDHCSCGVWLWLCVSGGQVWCFDEVAASGQGMDVPVADVVGSFEVGICE